MTIKVQSTLIQKNDLMKDYTNFALVIILSFFFKYSVLELAESIWFFSVVLAVSMLLFQLIKCFEYNNFTLSRMVSIVAWGLVFTIFYFVELLGIREVLGYKEVPISIKDFIFYVPFIPFVLYAHRKYFQYFVWREDRDDAVFSFASLTWGNLFILFILIGMFQKNETLCFYVVYTLFFFPFTKTYKYLKQKKEGK